LIRDGRIDRSVIGIAGQMTSIPRRLVRYHNLALESGVLAAAVESGGPADRAGLRDGDVIIDFDGHPVASVDDLHRYLTDEVVGKRIALTVLRYTEKIVRYVVPEASKGQ
jgi:S1-C subfamily serine protease